MDFPITWMKPISENPHITAGLKDEPDELLVKPQGEKWSVAEQIIHLNKSVSPLNSTMGLPKLTFLFFGKVSFSRSYEEVVSLYKTSLSKGGKAAKAYVPKANTVYDRQQLIIGFEKAYEKYIDHVGAWSEKELDTYRLPHPLIGKLTMREMAYFTQYHLQHHKESIQSFTRQ